MSYSYLFMFPLMYKNTAVGIIRPLTVISWDVVPNLMFIYNNELFLLVPVPLHFIRTLLQASVDPLTVISWGMWYLI